MKQLIEYIKTHYLGEDCNVTPVVWSGSRGEMGFITVFFWSNGTPTLVAKVARTGEGLEGLRREYASLREVAGLVEGSPLETTIDTALALVEVEGLTVLLKQYKDGIPGTKYVSSLFSRKRRVERFLNVSTDWLINFTKQTRQLHLDSLDAKRMVIDELTVENPIERYPKLFIEDTHFFLAPTHGELLPPNILIDQRNGQLRAILDFENFGTHGLPIADLLGLIVSTGGLLFGLDEVGMNCTFLGKGWFVNVCSDCIRKFCREFSIDISAFREVMPLYSDRAIQLCRKWNMRAELLTFHQQLRTFLIEKKSDMVPG